MLDGWRTAQFSTLSLIPGTSADVRTPQLVFETTAIGTKKMSVMMLSASLPSSTVRDGDT